MTPGSQIIEVCHVVGKIGKNGEKGVLGIFESDGHIESVSDFLPTSEWFYPPSGETGSVPKGARNDKNKNKSSSA